MFREVILKQDKLNSLIDEVALFVNIYNYPKYVTVIVTNFINYCKTLRFLLEGLFAENGFETVTVHGKNLRIVDSLKECGLTLHVMQSNLVVTHCHHSIFCRRSREAPATTQRYYRDATQHVLPDFIFQSDSCVNIIKV